MLEVCKNNPFALQIHSNIRSDELMNLYLILVFMNALCSACFPFTIKSGNNKLMLKV